jgi:hypothetical protein
MNIIKFFDKTSGKVTVYEINKKTKVCEYVKINGKSKVCEIHHE